MNLILKLNNPTSAKVTIWVSSKKGYCNGMPTDAEKRLRALETKGFKTSVSVLTAYSARYFDRVPSNIHLITRSKPSRPDLFFAAWLLLSMSDPRIVSGRLIYSAVINERVQSVLSELVGIGTALLIGERIYGIPEALWTSTTNNANFDFFGKVPVTNKVVLLEARGRVEARRVGEAVKQIQTKFNSAVAANKKAIKSGKPPPYAFDYALGVIACPRQSVHKRASDVVVVDPEGEGNVDGPFGTERRILEHYAQFFRDQHLGFAIDIARVLALDDDRFKEYLEQGDSKMVTNLTAIAYSGRASFRFRDRAYRGTVYVPSTIPVEFLGASVEFPWPAESYWCLDKEIASLIAQGKMREVLDYRAEPGVFFHNDIQLFLYADGAAVAMGPQGRMGPSMFEGFDEDTGLGSET